VADAFEQLPHLVRLALADHDPPPRVQSRRGRPHQLHRVGHHAHAHHDRAAPETHAVTLVRNSPDLDAVLAQHAVAGVRQPQGELAIVGQDDKTLRVEVEASHWKDALADFAAEEVEHGGAALGVGGRGDEPVRLVQREVAQPLWGFQPLAVHFHGIPLRVGLVAERRRSAVDRHAALPDERLRLAARTHACASDQLLQPLTRHRPLRPNPVLPPQAWAERRGPRARTAQGTPCSCGRAAACRPPACGPQ